MLCLAVSISPLLLQTLLSPSVLESHVHRTLILHLCQFLYSFSYLCLYNTDLVKLLNYSHLIGVNVLNLFLFHFCCTPSDLRGCEEFENLVNKFLMLLVGAVHPSWL